MLTLVFIALFGFKRSPASVYFPFYGGSPFANLRVMFARSMKAYSILKFQAAFVTCRATAVVLFAF